MPVVAAYLGQSWLAKGLIEYAFAAAVVGGFLSGAIATGTLKGALWGAASAAVFFGIGSYFQVDKLAAGGQASKEGVIAAVKSGATTGQTLAKIAAHAGAGGTLNVLQGGKFGHGFVAAGFTEALSPAVGQFGDRNDFGTILAKTAASAAIGGTASKLSGGSFANGAKTGAFQQLFNSSIHEMMKPGPDWQGGSGEPSLMDSGFEGSGGPDSIFSDGGGEGAFGNGGFEGASPSCTQRCVYSASGGTVAKSNWENPDNHAQGFGFRIRITATDGTTFVYGHMSPLSVISTDDAVVAGQFLGQYANPTNGSSTAPHLHFEHRSAAGVALDASAFLNTVMPNHRVSSGFGTRIIWGRTQNHPGHDLVGGN